MRRDLLAVGAANVAGGGTTQTAGNRHAGPCTQLTELVSATATVAALRFLAPVIALMPGRRWPRSW